MTRRGYKRAVVAIAHKILIAIYHMLSQQVSYNDLGDLYLDKLNKNHLTRNLESANIVLDGSPINSVPC